VLNYTPSQARQFTLPEFECALRGWQSANGVKPNEEKFMSRNELLDLIGK